MMGMGQKMGPSCRQTEGPCEIHVGISEKRSGNGMTRKERSEAERFFKIINQEVD